MGSAHARVDRHRSLKATQHFDQPIGHILMDVGAITPDQLADAMVLQSQSGASIEQVALAEGMIAPEQMVDAVARKYATLQVNRQTTPPDADLAGLLPVAFCLEHSLVPWKRIGEAVLIATSRPDHFKTIRSDLPAELQPAILGVASEHDIHTTLADWHRSALRDRAETRVPDEMSCRSLNKTVGLKLGPLVLGVMLLALVIYDARFFFAGLAMWATVSLILAAGLKLAAFLAHFKIWQRPAPPPVFHHRPRVSMLVPLFHETNIALELIDRLRQLRYPKSHLDIVLVLEEEDAQTRDVLAHAELPNWMRIIVVPKGAVTTKPRAMNYALNFCQSDIIGIYDAEDSPDPNQIDDVVARFAASGPEVACLQGILDFYNPKANWFSRCFAIEYATWFRVVLPGLSRLGFAIPLGGTTVFFRREALEKVDAWDAHNVTEDADLGVRLARFGYVTELIATVTREEACNRFWPWVRQRSRWLKGYMVTYLAHMRHPVRLYRDLKAWKFIGFQLFFLTTLSQFLLAPVLWSFWLVLLGFTHPLDSWIARETIFQVGIAFLVSEVIALLIGIFSVSRTSHKGLAIWVPTLAFYFPMGCIAAYKGLFELVARPFFWDKTTHGTPSA